MLNANCIVIISFDTSVYCFFFSALLSGAKPNLELKLQDFGPDPDDCFLGLTLAVKPSVSNLGIVLVYLNYLFTIENVINICWPK